MFCGIGGALVLSGLVLLTWIDQDDARHSFGHAGGMHDYSSLLYSLKQIEPDHHILTPTFFLFQDSSARSFHCYLSPAF